MRRYLVVLSLGMLVLGAAAAAGASNMPGRTQTRPGSITDLALTQASIAFAVAATRTDCHHVELWNPDLRGTWRFGRPRPCGDATSTGSGIWDLSVASSRVVWLAYTGGNIREWSLLTATTTRRTPRRIRFLARDVDEPPPIVLGDGARDGVPYAIGREVVFLGDNGAAIFRWTAPESVVALTAGPAPGDQGARVAVVTEAGTIFVLSKTGAVLRQHSYPRGSVRAIKLAGVGLVAQVGDELFDGTFRLPPSAQMLDYAQGRVLYRIDRAVYTHRVATGVRAQLPGSPTVAGLVSLDVHGLAWAVGRSVHWKCAGCIRYGN